MLCNILRLMSHLVPQLNENLSSLCTEKNINRELPLHESEFQAFFIVAHKILQQLCEWYFQIYQNVRRLSTYKNDL